MSAFSEMPTLLSKLVCAANSGSPRSPKHSLGTTNLYNLTSVALRRISVSTVDTLMYILQGIKKIQVGYHNSSPLNEVELAFAISSDALDSWDCFIL